jgi:sulfur relay (sulfurtransferase) DsrC/TusE family protein
MQSLHGITENTKTRIMKYGKRKQESWNNELTDGVTLNEAKIFIIRMAREYFQELDYVPQADVLIDDVYKEYFLGKPNQEHFPEWLVRMKVAEVKRDSMDKIKGKQIKMLF